MFVTFVAKTLYYGLTSNLTWAHTFLTGLQEEEGPHSLSNTADTYVSFELCVGELFHNSGVMEVGDPVLCLTSGLTFAYWKPRVTLARHLNHSYLINDRMRGYTKSDAATMLKLSYWSGVKSRSPHQHTNPKLRVSFMCSVCAYKSTSPASTAANWWI